MRLVKGIEIEVFFVSPDDVKPFLLRIQNLHIVFAVFRVLVKVILDPRPVIVFKRCKKPLDEDQM
jgi:hypothetical protein